MNWLRPLGATGLKVSALGLGTVKLGRNQGVRYPEQFEIPDRRHAAALLAQAQELGINLIDTAPAYGESEERLGSLLEGSRDQWVICSKVGEEFFDGKSNHDFSPAHTRGSVERSLRRLRTDVLDIVLVHSNGDDLHIIREMDTLQTLADLKQAGLIRAYGMSTKTIAGGLAAVALCDVLMLTYNLGDQEQSPVLAACAAANKGVLIKKALAGGHTVAGGQPPHSLKASMDLVLSHPGTGAAIVGTIDPTHLEANVNAARESLT